MAASVLKASHLAKHERPYDKRHKLRSLQEPDPALELVRPTLEAATALRTQLQRLLAFFDSSLGLSVVWVCKELREPEALADLRGKNRLAPQARQFHSDLSEAMSIEKRYFTSDFNIRA